MSPGSSTDISEDWEKDFDLDMTEEEVQMALSKMDASGEVSGPDEPGSEHTPTSPAVPLGRVTALHSQQVPPGPTCAF